MNFASIILAAGMGKRMGGNYPKVLFELNGKYLIDHVVDTVSTLNSKKTILVVGFGKELIETHYAKNPEIIFAHQKQQLGTADAVKSAIPALGEFDGSVIVLCGDVPLIPIETIRDMISYHQEQKLEATVLTVELDDAQRYGRIIRNQDNLIEKIVEAADATSEELEVKEINSGAYVFNSKSLIDNITKISSNNEQSEFYLTDIIEILKKQNKRVGAFLFKGAGEYISGVNRPEDLQNLEKFLSKNDAL